MKKTILMFSMTAWILWANHSNNNSWIPMGGYTARLDCMDYMEGIAAGQMTKPSKGVTDVTLKDQLWVDFKDGSRIMFTCFPDTIDPRTK